MDSIIETSEKTALINVFQFPFLTETECQNMTNTILENRYRFPHDGSMKKNTVDATNILGDILQNRILKDLTPTINMLFDFDQPQGYSLYTAHAIIYSASGEGEKGLSLHVDDSDITVNITLHSSNLTGSELSFTDTTEYGNEFCMKNLEKMKKKIEKTSTVTQFKTVVRNCILHRGSHPHSTTGIYTGERIALILWLKKNGTPNTKGE
jgi:hypothetical protein